MCFLLCDMTLTFQLHPCRGCTIGASPPGWFVQQNGLQQSTSLHVSQQTVKTDSGGLFSTRLLHLQELRTVKSAARTRQFHSRWFQKWTSGCSLWVIHWKRCLKLEKQPPTPPANRPSESSNKHHLMFSSTSFKIPSQKFLFG